WPDGGRAGGDYRRWVIHRRPPAAANCGHLEESLCVNDATRERLFGWQHAFDHPVTVGITAGVAAVLIVAPLIMLLLSRLGWIDSAQRQELGKRYRSWLILIPLMGVPVLLGAAWTMLAVAVLSLLCYREYARATGLFREKTISLMVTLGILGVIF